MSSQLVWVAATAAAAAGASLTLPFICLIKYSKINYAHFSSGYLFFEDASSDEVI